MTPKAAVKAADENVPFARPIVVYGRISQV
jgi:hypothetical protein